MSEPASLTVALADEAATAALMADIAMLTGAGDVIALRGDLGAGKTAAARALIRYLAGDETLEVPSPTYTLVQSYDLAAGAILHADLYRIDEPSEVEEIGLFPLPDFALTLIEWPERAAGLMPPDRIEILLSHRSSLGVNARAAEITGHGKAAAKVARLTALRQFLQGAALVDAKRERMPGDASTRSYARLIRKDGSVILMNSPRRPDGPPQYDGKSYSAAVHLAEDVRPFVAIANGLRERGFSAPAIHHADLESGFLVTEDFGRAGFVEGDPPAPITARYERAADLLASLHSEALPADLPIAPKVNYRVPEFDRDAMTIEIGLMLEWYLPDRNVAVTPAMQAEFTLIWNELLPNVLTARKTWVLRDFHSPNLIWLDNRSDTACVGLLDFQDAVIGPHAYDLVSLLQDARVDVPEALELAMLARYVKERRETDPSFDPASFAETYAIMSAQRNTRLLGTFARLNRRDGKPQYLKHQPRVWGYLQRALTHPTLGQLREWCDSNIPDPSHR